MLGIGTSLRSARGLRSSVAFDPATLFANNEPGVWYDPSQAANLDWRRNLLVQTEQSITEISLACGFQSTSHFSKVFRGRFGRSPLSHRTRLL